MKTQETYEINLHPEDMITVAIDRSMNTDLILFKTSWMGNSFNIKTNREGIRKIRNFLASYLTETE